MIIRPAYDKFGDFAGFSLVDGHGDLTPPLSYKALARQLIEIRDGIDCDFDTNPPPRVAPKPFGCFGELPA